MIKCMVKLVYVYKTYIKDILKIFVIFSCNLQLVNFISNYCA